MNTTPVVCPVQTSWFNYIRIYNNISCVYDRNSAQQPAANSAQQQRGGVRAFGFH